MFKKFLTHPLTCDLDIDSPASALVRGRIVREKDFLNRIYREWYFLIKRELDDSTQGPVLELGSAGGFFQEIFPAVISTEVFWVPGIKAVVSGLALPMPSNSLFGIVMTNVFHHLPHPRKFLQEAERCLMPNGMIIMIEPWVTPWARLVYGNLHHEQFDPAAVKWEFQSTGPLSSANGALPWIIFQRDYSLFQKSFPSLCIRMIQPFMPFRYLLSGGISMRNLMPAWSFSLWSSLEKALSPWMRFLAMFALIVVEKSYPFKERSNPTPSPTA